jgi:hypothetical protein
MKSIILQDTHSLKEFEYIPYKTDNGQIRFKHVSVFFNRIKVEIDTTAKELINLAKLDKLEIRFPGEVKYNFLRD